ncbi:MAG: LptA/OstA family protein [Verrucomicrobiota bacterium]
MKTTIPTLLLVFAAGLRIVQAAEESQYQIEFKLMEVPQDWVREQGLQKTPVEVKTNLFETVNEAGDIDLLSAPRIVTRENQDARIEIKENALEYFQKGSAGYELKHLPEDQRPGLSINMKATPIPDRPGNVRLEWNASIVTVTERVPLPGVSLDVGKPLVNKREASSSVDCFDDRWMLLAGMQTLGDRGEGSLLLFAKVSKYTPEPKNVAPPVSANITANSIQYDRARGVTRCQGDVRLDDGELTLYADRLELRQNPPEGPAIQADALSFESSEGRIRLDGHVQYRTTAGLVTSDRLVIERKPKERAAEPSPLEKKLRSIIVPELEFREVTLPVATEHLQRVSGHLDSEGVGVNFVLKRQDGLEDIRITISLRQVSLYEAIHYVTEVSGLEFRLGERAVIIE